MGIRYFIALILIIFAIFPAIWVISAAINPAGTLTNPQIIPDRANLNNFDTLLNSDYYPFKSWMFNSLYIATVSTALVVMITTLSAYAISRFRFVGRPHLVRGILIINVFPGVVSMVALYSMIQQVGVHFPLISLDSHASLIVIYVSGAMGINVLLVKGFLDSIPTELDEAALIDGASHWLVFWRIIIPLAKPIMVTISILTFMAIYGDFVLPRILINSTDKLTVMVGLNLFQAERFAQDWGVFTAGAILAAIPVICAYLVLQKYIISGLTTGSIKG
jgi:ABC-type maltose transport system permease subunit